MKRSGLSVPDPSTAVAGSLFWRNTQDRTTWRNGVQKSVFGKRDFGNKLPNRASRKLATRARLPGRVLLTGIAAECFGKTKKTVGIVGVSRYTGQDYNGKSASSDGTWQKKRESFTFAAEFEMQQGCERSDSTDVEYRQVISEVQTQHPRSMLGSRSVLVELLREESKRTW